MEDINKNLGTLDTTMGPTIFNEFYNAFIFRWVLCDKELMHLFSDNNPC